MCARHVVEAGTSFGVSTIYLATAVRDNGGGTVIATEYEQSKAESARRNFAEAGIEDIVDLREVTYGTHCARSTSPSTLC